MVKLTASENHSGQELSKIQVMLDIDIESKTIQSQSGLERKILEEI